MTSLTASESEDRASGGAVGEDVLEPALDVVVAGEARCRSRASG
jgi:hypothetical protein